MKPIVSSRCSFDVMLVGDTDVGKTSLLLENNDVKPSATIGAEYTTKSIMLEDSLIRLNLCDTSGQERFKKLLRTYYTNCQGAIVVYDIQDRKSYEQAQDWIADLREAVSPELVIALAGNKLDMEANRQVPKKEASDFAHENNCIFLETSTVTAKNVLVTFQALVIALKNQDDKLKKEKHKNEKRKKKKCGCFPSCYS